MRRLVVLRVLEDRTLPPLFLLPGHNANQLVKAAAFSKRDRSDPTSATSVCTVSAFSPVSLDPPLVAVSLIAGSYPAELLGRLDRFAVTILAAGQRALAGRFAAAGRPGARLMLDGVPHRRGPLSGALIPDGALAALGPADLRQAADAWGKVRAAAGIDQNKLLAGIDQPGVQRRRDAHLGQVGVLEKFFGARFVAGEQRVVEREAAIAQHRHLVVADFYAVIAGRLRAGDWRSHVLLPYDD